MKHQSVLKSVDCWSGDYTLWKAIAHVGDWCEKVLVKIVVASLFLRPKWLASCTFFTVQPGKGAANLVELVCVHEYLGRVSSRFP